MRTPRIVLGLASAALGVLRLSAPADAQSTTRVSVDSSGGEENAVSFLASISADGEVAAFCSDASNLVSGDTNASTDVFVHDRRTGLTERISVNSSGAEGNLMSWNPAISADGQVVAFQSGASNLVAGDTNGQDDIFVHDRATGLTERVSVDSAGIEANNGSLYSSLSADGQIVAFTSTATNLVSGDTNLAYDVFVHDRTNGITERVSVDSAGVEGDSDSSAASLSADGQIVAFVSDATNLVPKDTNFGSDVFVHDRSTGITDRVSVDSSGGQVGSGNAYPAISADGQVVSFESDATTLVAGDTNDVSDVFVHERSSGLTERISVDSSGMEGNSYSYVPSISADGQIVVFESYSTNLVAGDTNGATDVFVRDRSSGLTARVSVDASGGQGNRDSICFTGALSADGQVVAFCSLASNLVAGDTNGLLDVFVHDECGIAASWSNYGAGFPGTLGVPSFTSQQNPAFGSTVTLDLANSYGNPTVGLLLVGFQRASIHTNRGGDLLVVPALVSTATFSYGGDSFTGDIPDDRALCGVTIDLQAIETDPGAARGVSFTQGLELVLGE